MTMATPSNHSLSLYRGDSYQWTFRFWLDQQHTQPVDLTGVSVRAAIAVGNAITPLPCSLTLPNEILMTLDGATWNGIMPGSGRWDLELTDATGWVSTPIAGSVSVRADVTMTVGAAS
jgi:hypothetical protein